MAEEYEIVPEEDVEALRKQVEDIKKNPFGSTPSGRELSGALNNLNDSINHLTALFRDAADAMKLEEKESEAIGKKLEPMLMKLDTLIDQNEKIAKGLIGIASIVKEDMEKKKEEHVEAKPEKPAAEIPHPGTSMPGASIPGITAAPAQKPPAAMPGPPPGIATPTGAPATPPPPTSAPPGPAPMAPPAGPAPMGPPPGRPPAMPGAPPGPPSMGPGPGMPPPGGAMAPPGVMPPPPAAPKEKPKKKLFGF
ncbi:hypothetical protein ACFL96_17255 [Thermoproteota archaeon]